MMTIVYLVTYFGEQAKALIARFLKPKKSQKRFTRSNRCFVTLWKKDGFYGVSFFSPLFLTSIGGAIILITLGAKNEQIFPSMWASAIFWGLILTLLVKYVRDFLL